VPNKTAFINIGSRERVTPGLKFLVGNRGVQGKFEYKAKIEVKKAWMTYCEVAIIESYDKDRPVVEGDAHREPALQQGAADRRGVRRRGPPAEAAVHRRRGVAPHQGDRQRGPQGGLARRRLRDLHRGGLAEDRESYDPYKKAVFLEIPIADATDIFRFLGD
jgi:hypothetical protein